ncbi:histone deacetylase family protein [Polymorphobacter sp.]|uniref:histone deacetylase family protein n=1 Tax=Polymorphobacter sp. TaxID=1909290 RepID=UPI003F724E69
MTPGPARLPLFHAPGYAVRLADGHPVPMNKYTALPGAIEALGQSVLRLDPEPAPQDWVEAVHAPDYAAAVIAADVPAAIERRIGFAVTPAVAARSLLVAGGTHGAALWALEHGWAANGAGGSHHAGPQGGAGYCVINDIAVAAEALVRQRRVARILIVDLDVHQGDGTAVIFAGRSDVLTFSMHAERNYPARKARSFRDVGLPDGTSDDVYLERLAAELAGLIGYHQPQLMLFQAGVDVHADDRLGRLALSDAGLVARDVMVAEAARRHGIPLAVTLGGGYAEPVLLARRHAAGLIAQWQAMQR